MIASGPAGSHYSLRLRLPFLRHASPEISSGYLSCPVLLLRIFPHIPGASARLIRIESYRAAGDGSEGPKFKLVAVWWLRVDTSVLQARVSHPRTALVGSHLYHNHILRAPSYSHRLHPQSACSSSLPLIFTDSSRLGYTQRPGPYLGEHKAVWPVRRTSVEGARSGATLRMPYRQGVERLSVFRSRVLRLTKESQSNFQSIELSHPGTDKAQGCLVSYSTYDQDFVIHNGQRSFSVKRE